MRTLRRPGEFLISDQLSNGSLRPAVATRGNARNIVDFQDSSAIRLDVGKILGVFPGFVNHISVSWIRVGEEIPSTRIGEPISGKQLEGSGGLSSLKERLALKLVLQCKLCISGNVVMS